MRGADTVAVRDGGEALHMDTKETGERSCLHLADLGKARGHMRNRAVMLAELLTNGRRQRRRYIAVLGQCACESLSRCGVRCRVCDPLLVALLAIGHSRLCKERHSLGAGRGREELESLDGQVVVSG